MSNWYDGDMMLAFRRRRLQTADVMGLRESKWESADFASEQCSSCCRPPVCSPHNHCNSTLQSLTSQMMLHSGGDFSLVSLLTITILQF